MKLTFGTVKSACAKVLNINSSDSRVLDYVNRACERLLYEAGKSVDTLVRYACCIEDGCLVWPRDIETIEGWAQCNCPGTVRSQFYEFVGYGPGLMGQNAGYSSQLIDRGNVVVFSNVSGTGKKLAIYADGNEAPNAYVLIRYYDSNANKVFREYSGSVIEGERITIPGAGGYSLSVSEVLPGGVYEVIKPVTKRPIRLYEYDTTAATYRALSYYDPDETLPTYRSSLIPCLQNTSNSDCGTSRITVLAKRRFIPAINDDSVLIISHADAVRLACQAIKKEEDVGVAEAEQFWQLAIRCLNRQLRHWQGEATASPINFAGADRPIVNMI